MKQSTVAILSLLSVNVRGLNTPIKRRSIFLRIKDDNYDIVLYRKHVVRERESEPIWQKEWGGPAISTNRSNHSKGVMALIKGSLDHKITGKKLIAWGRFVIIHIEIDHKIFVLVKIYAPNTDKEQLNTMKI